MVVNDPIADFLTRIRNAMMVRLEKCETPSSQPKEDVAEVLKKEGFISDWSRHDDMRQEILTLYLKYGPDRQPALDGLPRRLRPGKRADRALTRIPRRPSTLGT